jgi:hypothetical protein
MGLIGALGAAVLASPLVSGAFTSAGAAAISTNAYTAVAPTRVLDTRIGLGAPAHLANGGSFVLDIGGIGPVPGSASAVVLNLTVTNADGPGYVTAWPADRDRSTTSVINFESVGQTIADLVTVPLSADGRVAFFASVGVDLIADVQGYYAPATASRAGRLVPMTPTRVLDTRLPNAVTAGKIAANQSVDVDFVPWGVANDATAVVLNMTVTEATAPGYWTAYATGTNRPQASNVNITTVGQTIPNQVITPLSAGKATFFAQSGGHLILDLVGYFTGPSAPSSSEGLFVPVAPSRLLDTRDRTNGPGLKPGANSQVRVPVAGRGTIPTSNVAAVALTATITGADAPGYFTVWPAGTSRPTVSNLNAVHDQQTIANHVVIPVTASGFDFYTQSGADLVADVTGWFTGSSGAIPTPGTPLSFTPPPPVPDPGPTGPPDVGGYVIKWGLAPDGSTHFDTTSADDVPFHWDPCKPIRYAVNLNGYDQAYRANISDAIARVAKATGLSFASVGDSTVVPTQANPWGYAINDFLAGTTPYDIIISLANESITDLVPGSLAGLTYPDWFQHTGKPGRFFVASITIDLGDLAGHDVWAGDGFEPVLLHELGHAVGLDHTTDNHQIMYPGATPSSPQSYASGDLRGLWRLGTSLGCGGF